MKTLCAILAMVASTVQITQAAQSNEPQQVSLSVTDKGFEPSHLTVEPGRETILTVTRKTDDTCAKSVLIPKLKIKKDLPLNQPVEIKIAKLKKGEFKFSCGMKMTGGVILVK